MSDPSNDEAASEEEWRRSEYPRWKVLDPAGEPKNEVFSTVYVADELIIRPHEGVDVPGRVESLQSIANRAGWNLEERELEDGREPGRSESRRARLTVAPSDGTGVTAQTPDAWEVLRQARADGIAGGVSLNHVLSTDSLGLNPFKANPFKANPFKANPFKANPFKANAAGVGIDSYGAVGFGGRQPVTYLGPEPVFGSDRERRPVVAVFDTGLGVHPWYDGDVRLPPTTTSGPIGIIRQDTDPEVHPSLAVPLDGIFDDASGHGTFIAGIVRQECPRAQILAVRVADGDGIILEAELIGALGRLLDYMEEGNEVQVLNLSFSFYHETPTDENSISDMMDLLQQLRDKDVVVICSAGNEATDRPTFPAALPRTGERHVSVGALNPASRSVALFSNIGRWVDVYAPGVSLVSTVPVKFDGGVQAGTRDDKYDRRRETLDIDDFRGGFGVWSGTSFAAPVVAGRIAARIAEGYSPADAVRAVLKELEAGDHSQKT